MIKSYKAFLAERNKKTGAKWYQIEAKADPDHCCVYIYDEIGAYGLTAKDFVTDFDKISARNITLRINTHGGNVFDGLPMFNAIKSHPAHVEVHIDGIAASMGTIIALAGDVVNMADNAFFMVHDPWSVVVGNAATMRKEADVLDKIGTAMVKIYADKTGLSESDVVELLSDETWMNAEEAKAFGFVDNITAGTEETSRALAKFDLSVFAKAPELKTFLSKTDVRLKRLALMELE